MQDPYFLRIRRVISDDRLETYRINPADGEVDLLGCYFWNMALSEALYPTLQCLEVALRNAVHNALSGMTGTQDWYDVQPTFLTRSEQDDISYAKAYLASQRKPADTGRIVAELRFGFWTTLFDRRYETNIRPLLKDMFPGMRRHIRNHRVVTPRLNQMRTLRNRVFHHEPIIKVPDLDQRHRNLLETIDWISPTLRSSLLEIDRFPSVYAQGSTAYGQKVNALLQKRLRMRQKQVDTQEGKKA